MEKSKATNLPSLKEQISDILETHRDDDHHLVQELENIIKQDGERVYPVIFEMICRLKLDSEKGAYLWNGVLAHKKEMERRFEQNVGIRTSLCDYLCTVNNTLANPMVVETRVFEDHTQAHMYDYLTGLYSRGFLNNTLERELALSKRHEAELSVLFFDIDHFKTVNDTYGHAAGDECLTMTAQIIKKTIRAEDTAVRYGGEEIVVILPRTGKTKAFAIAERIRKQTMAFEFVSQKTAFNVTISGGLASYPMDGYECKQLLAHADQAMYKAKADGRNNVVAYSSEKRRYVRMDFNTQIKVQPVGFHEDPEAFEAESRDISTRGILFETALFFKIGTKLKLHIPLTHSDASINVTGIVVRNELNPDGTYDTGISFMEIKGPAKDEIFAYLSS